MKSFRTKILLFSFLLLLLPGQSAHAQDSHAMAINVARTEVLEDVQKAWSKADAKIPYFEVVELKSKEYRRIFPKGLAHLPETLLPRAIYPATTEPDARRWQYLGTRALNGFHFAIFKLVTSVDEH